MNLHKIAAGLLALALLVPGTQAAASAPRIKVKLPTFQVELNGAVLDNAHAKYPVLVYNDITYFPMTWDNAQALGLGVEWTRSDGLSVTSDRFRAPLAQDMSGSNSPGKTYEAEPVSGAVKVDGAAIDNASEPYPLFSFRDVTYFPMTWRFTRDSFHWETEWNDQTGYHIRGKQFPVLFAIVADDKTDLFVRTGTEGLYKVSKRLDGSVAKLSAEEEKAVGDNASANQSPFVMPKPLKIAQTVKRDADSLVYNGGKLLSLKPYEDQIAAYKAENPGGRESGVDFYEQTYPVDSRTSVLVVTVYYLTHIPAPYTPHEYHVFTIRDGKATPIDGFHQQPDKLAVGTDGGFWLASTAPPRHDVTARNSSIRGQLAYVGKDGVSRLLNEQLQADDIDLLAAGNGSMLVRAANDRMNPAARKESDGFYRVDEDLNAVKTGDSVRGVAYADRNGDIFVLDPDTNSITDFTHHKAYRWWDYQLRKDL